MSAVVIVRFDRDGQIDYHVAGDVRLFIVDECAPGDRVYEWLERASPDALDAVIGPDEPIGSREDERHAALSAVIAASNEGRRSHLSVVRS